MRIRSVWLTKFMAWLVVTTLKVLFATCRKRFVIAPGTSGWDADVEGRFLYAVWHDVLFFPLLMAKPQHMSALASQHQDGSYIAETLRLLNVQPFRGSTNRGGARALKQLLHAADRLHITLTPDGPRGPRRTLKEGIVFLASRTGQPIVPAAFSCRLGVRIQGTWTDMLLPLPFTTTFCMLGEPISVPPNLSREQIDRVTREVQEAIDRLYARVEDWAAGKNQCLCLDDFETDTGSNSQVAA